MSKRWYVSPVIGDGSWLNPWRPAVSDAQKLESGSGIVSVISSTFPFALCKVGAINHGPLAAVADVDQFPDITLDSTLSVLTSQQRNALLNFLTKRGVSTTGLNTNSTFAEVIERIGQHLDPNFKVANFDINAN